MTYVEFPFDQIIDLHIKKKDDPPPEPPDDEECGSYQWEIGGTFGLGGGLGGAWWSSAPMGFSSNGFIVPAQSFDENGFPIPIVVHAHNAVSITIEYSLTVTETSANNRPNGTPVLKWSDTAVGFGTVDYATYVPDPARPLYIAPPDEPNLASTSVSVPGDSSLTGTVDVRPTYLTDGSLQGKSYAVFIMSKGIVEAHNVHTENPGPAGWNQNEYRASGLIKITAMCGDPLPPPPDIVFSPARQRRARWSP